MILEREISFRLTNRGYNEVVKAIWNWACKPFLPCQQDYIFSVPANERWQVVVAGVLMLLIVPAFAVGVFLHWIGFAIGLTLFVVVELFFDGWNEVPLKVIRRRNLRDWKAGFLQGLLLLTIIPFALDVFSRDLMMVYSLVVGSLLTVPYMKLVRQMYLRAGENAPPPSFDLTPPPVED